MRSLLATVMLGLGLLSVMPAQAQKSADTLRVAWRDRIADVDPYYNSLRTGLVLSQQVWDGLVFRDPASSTLKPLLATAWRWVDPTTLELTLRPNVTFHNGDKFTAADVVYTVGIVTDPQAGLAVPAQFDWLAGAEAVDALTVRLKLWRPFPAALDYLAAILPIYPQAYRSRVGHAGFSRAPIGTGPYRFTKQDPQGLIELERYPGYYDGGGKGRALIGHVTIRQVADATAEIDALLAGQADWIWQFNPELYDAIAREAAVTALRQDSLRIAQITFNVARGPAASPLTDLRVRQAVIHAINRQAFIRQFSRNPAKVPDAPCHPAQFGCDPTAAKHYDYDPDKARGLLATAGYPNGFDIDVVSTGISLAWGTAIQDDLMAVGIRARIVNLAPDAALARVEAGDVGLFLSAFGASSIADVAATLPYFFGGGPDDMARDALVEAAIHEGGATVDPLARKLAYARAIRRVTEQAYTLPLATLQTVYGVSRTLDVKPYPDEMPRFFWMKWK